MDLTQASKWMQLFNQKIQEEQDYLSELDTPIGDGDHGGNMARGLEAVQNALHTTPPTTVDQLLQTSAMKLISTVGGASGPLYGSAFMGMAKAAKEGASDQELFQAGLDMIVKRGKASVGEKTMVDVWSGVLNLLADDQLTADAIDQLVLASKDIQATKGRASYVGERSIGHIDPGSYSSGILFKSYLESGGPHG